MAHTHICDMLYSIDIYRDSILCGILGRCLPIGRVIRMPRWYSNTTMIKQEAVLVHNIVHLEQQKFSPLYAIFVWLPKYILSRKFRGIAEMEAFWAQMEHLTQCRDASVRYTVIESRLCEMYFGAISRRLSNAFTLAFSRGDKPDDWSKFYEQNR